MVLFHQLDCILLGTKSLQSGSFYQPSFPFVPPSSKALWSSSLVYIRDRGNSGANRTLEIGLGPTVGLRWIATSLVAWLANWFPLLTRLVPLWWPLQWMTAPWEGFQTASNSWRISSLFLISFPLLLIVPFLYKWLHEHVTQQRCTLRQCRCYLVFLQCALVPGWVPTAQPLLPTILVARPQPLLSHLLSLLHSLPCIVYPGRNFFRQ